MTGWTALLVGWMAILVAWPIAAARPVERDEPAAVALAVAAPDQHRAVLQKYCVGCHNPRVKSAGLTLDAIDLTDVAAHADVLERVVKKLRAGVMPPAGRPRPDAPTYASLTAFLETELDRAAAADPNPGYKEALHRLNRAEARNAIRDLLGLEVNFETLVPADDSSFGFDNIAGVQRMSPRLLDRYVIAAQKISRIAMGSVLVPAIDAFQMREDLRQDHHADGLPFGTRGGMRVDYTFPADGTYAIAVKLVRRSGPGEEIPEFDEPQPLIVSLDGHEVGRFTLAGRDRTARRGGPDSSDVDRRTLDADWRVVVPVQAGRREILVTFLNRTPALLENFVEPFQRAIPQGQAYTTAKGAYVRDVEVSGPFDVAGAGDSPSRRRILICRPAQASEEAGCARRILSTLARRAYRRPVGAADVDRLMAFYDQARHQGGFEGGVERAIAALLVSPEFLFRVESRAPAASAAQNRRVPDLELASRLSFFLWSSIPDDELLDLAERGQLNDPAVFERQARRLLADRRSSALTENFAGQWLSLRNVPAVERDSNRAPDFDEDLRQAFRRETELLFESVLHEDRPVVDFLRADYSFVNERLARHYGIPNVYGTHFRRVELKDERRRGLLGHGSFLAVNSSPTRTSPVLRGKWVLANILGTPPADPPPNVPDLKEQGKEPTDLIPSMREQMATHRSNPVCSSCHAVMDPPGLALENFDFVGRWRDVDESWKPIDTSGTLPDGTKFDGVVELRKALVERSDQFVLTMTEKLLTYALGRGLEYYDAPAVRRIVRDAATGNYRFSALILGVTRSLPFQMTRAVSDQQAAAAHP